MIDWLKSFEFTSTAGLLLYWLPLAFCAVAYVIRTWANYQQDVKARQKAEAEERGYYSHTDTYGSLIGRALAATVPGVNIIATAFDAGPDLYRYVEKTFDRPLVPKRK